MKNWEKRFDKKWENDWLSLPGDGCEERDPDDIRAFIHQTLKEQAHDHEILVNTILETKNRELKEQREEIIKEVEKLKDEWETEPPEEAIKITSIKPAWIPIKCPNCLGYKTVKWGSVNCPTCGGDGFIKVPPDIDG